jgi:hypothetical protein
MQNIEKKAPKVKPPLTAPQISRLDAVAAAALGRGPAVAPRTQTELILHRIASGRGRPVPLPQIQQGPGSAFVSDPQARIHELRGVYDIGIDCRWGNQRKQSSYWLELDEAGCPKRKTADAGRKKKPLSLVTAQPVLFEPEPASLFTDFEMGKRTG